MLANWMGALAPLLANVTLLDITLPGAHDAMTYDLTRTLSDGYEGLGPVISKLLHAVSPAVAGEFVRTQSQTQERNVTALLDGGIRFLDFRIMFTTPPGRFFARDWYCLHGTQTKQTALTYLRQVRTWMDAHPSEIVVIWASRHGDNELNGTRQYPRTTPGQRQHFFDGVVATFGSLMFNSSQGSLNSTSFGTLLARDQRLVWYAADYAESTGSSPLALDGRLINNQLSGSLTDEAKGSREQAAIFRRASATRSVDKAANRFFLLSMADSTPLAVLENAALLHFLPFIEKQKRTAVCAAALNIPTMQGWCPMTQMDIALLANYYSQATLEAAYLDDASDFPHAIYIDGIDEGGVIRTGTSPANPLIVAAAQADGVRASTDIGAHGRTGYAYAATLVAANLKRMCRGGMSGGGTGTSTAHGVESWDARGGSVGQLHGLCASLIAKLEAERAKFPLQRWNDSIHGRLESWPSPKP